VSPGQAVDIGLGTKVQYQPDFKPACSQIVEALPGRRFLQLNNRFQFDDGIRENRSRGSCVDGEERGNDRFGKCFLVELAFCHGTSWTWGMRDSGQIQRGSHET